eukprot:TRINITY_DN33058_c0_g1_i1.p1 TRINITY_DN33058_c0_g1~~TRINITY_DN33058_c0_g1_i1.p1  ORF type:complete len:242 (-),score=8.01 TRINITY_DN33058_c0_g1_i1:85-810(-)
MRSLVFLSVFLFALSLIVGWCVLWLVDYTFEDVYCDLMFTCGCTWRWAGSWDQCNVHNMSLPLSHRCPFCASPEYGEAVAIASRYMYYCFALFVLLSLPILVHNIRRSLQAPEAASLHSSADAICVNRSRDRPDEREGDLEAGVAAGAAWAQHSAAVAATTPLLSTESMACETSERKPKCGGRCHWLHPGSSPAADVLWRELKSLSWRLGVVVTAYPFVGAVTGLIFKLAMGYPTWFGLHF